MELMYPERLGDYFEKVHENPHSVVYAVNEEFNKRLNKAYWVKIRKTGGNWYTAETDYKDFIMMQSRLTSEEKQTFRSEEKAEEFIKKQIQIIEQKYSMKLMLKS